MIDFTVRKHFNI